MNRWSDEIPDRNPLLAQVKEGMVVYDQEDQHIGQVDTVFFGAVSQEEDRTGTGATTGSTSGLTDGEHDPINFAFGGVLDRDVMNEMDGETVLKNRLKREGYVKVDTSGIFTSDVYVLPDQIASVSGDGLHLKVMKDSLIKGS